MVEKIKLKHSQPREEGEGSNSMIHRHQNRLISSNIEIVIEPFCATWFNLFKYFIIENSFALFLVLKLTVRETLLTDTFVAANSTHALLIFRKEKWKTIWLVCCCCRCHFYYSPEWNVLVWNFDALYVGFRNAKLDCLSNVGLSRS